MSQRSNTNHTSADGHACWWLRCPTNQSPFMPSQRSAERSSAHPPVRYRRAMRVSFFCTIARSRDECEASRRKQQVVCVILGTICPRGGGGLHAPQSTASTARCRRSPPTSTPLRAHAVSSELLTAPPISHQSKERPPPACACLSKRALGGPRHGFAPVPRHPEVPELPYGVEGGGAYSVGSWGGERDFTKRVGLLVLSHEPPPHDPQVLIGVAQGRHLLHHSDRVGEVQGGPPPPRAR